MDWNPWPPTNEEISNALMTLEADAECSNVDNGAYKKLQEIHYTQLQKYWRRERSFRILIWSSDRTTKKSGMIEFFQHLRQTEAWRKDNRSALGWDEIEETFKSLEPV